MLRPSVDGSGNGKEYIPLLGLILGSAIGGTALGLLITSVAKLFVTLGVTTVGLALGLLALAIAASFWPALQRWLPERSRQVLEADIYVYSPTVAAIRWGFQLGIGIRTHIVTPAFYGVLGLSLFVHPPLSFFIPVTYALTRGLAICVAAVSNAVLGGDERGFREARSLVVPVLRGSSVALMIASLGVAGATAV